MKPLGVCAVLAMGVFACVSAVAVEARSDSLVKTPKAAKPVTPEMKQKINDALPAKPTVQPVKPRKVLIFTRCQGHVHEVIPVTTYALERMGEKTSAFATVVSDDPAMLEAVKLRDFDVLCFNNTTRLELTSAQQQSIMDFLKAGKGIVGLHGAADNFFSWTEGAEMIGGQFAGHPWKAAGTWAIKVCDPGHPLNLSFDGNGFKVSDELYTFKAVPSQEQVRVLLEVDLSDDATGAKGGKSKKYAMSWIHPYKGGRVFYCGLGHNAAVFCTPAIMEHILAGIQYALGDLKAKDSPQ